MQKENISVKVDVKDFNKELVRVYKESNNALNSSNIENKSSTDLKRRVKSLE